MCPHLTSDRSLTAQRAVVAFGVELRRLWVFLHCLQIVSSSLHPLGSQSSSDLTAVKQSQRALMAMTYEFFRTWGGDFGRCLKIHSSGWKIYSGMFTAQLLQPILCLTGPELRLVWSVWSNALSTHLSTRNFLKQELQSAPQFKPLNCCLGFIFVVLAIIAISHPLTKKNSATWQRHYNKVWQCKKQKSKCQTGCK